MIPALVRFVEALRAEGRAISPAEVVDATRALDLVGIERRERVRAALKGTLAKDRRAAADFDRLFDLFFAPPARGAGESGGRRSGAAGERPRPGGGERPVASPKPSARREAERPRRAHAERIPDEAREELRRRLERARREGARGEGGRPRLVLRPAPPDAGDPAAADLARRMTTAEERAIAREVPRRIQAIRLQAGRRLERARTGRPWLRQVLRDSVSRGGVPFTIPFRTPRRKRTRVVLLVDVSYSVARAAGLFLLMAARFLELGRRTRVLAFVDRPVDVTSEIARWARGGARPPERPRRPRAAEGPRPGEGIVAGGTSFADVLDGVRGINLEAPSDYGRALHALLGARLRPRGRHTVLLVLGDGRTNRFDPLPWALEELARGCRAVVWLAPEPAARWGTHDSALPSYAPSVSLLVEATDLDGLASGVSLLARRL